MVIPLLSGGDGDGQAVDVGGQGAGGVGGVGARGIFEAVEVDVEGAGLVDAVGGEARVEEAGGFVGGGAAGGVAEDEEELLVVVAFEDGLKLDGFAVEGEFGEAGGGERERGADGGGYLLGVGRGEGGPLGGDVVARVGGVPVEAPEGGAGGRFRVFDAEGVAVAAVEEDEAEVFRGKDGGVRLVVGAEDGFDGGLAVEEEAGGEAGGGAVEGDVAGGNGEDAEVVGDVAGKADGVIGGEADGVVAILEPAEGDEGEPAVGGGDFGGVFGAPGGEVLLGGRGLGRGEGG